MLEFERREKRGWGFGTDLWVEAICNLLVKVMVMRSSRFLLMCQRLKDPPGILSCLC